MSAIPTSTQHCTKVPKAQKNNNIKTIKEDGKLSLFPGDMIMSIEKILKANS